MTGKNAEVNMFGIGPMELIVVAILAVVVVGPQRLPEVMKKMGRMFVQLRRQTHEIRQGFNDVVRDAERDLELERIRELKDQVDKLRDTNAIKSKITESMDISPEDITGQKKENKPPHSNEYHDSHYQDGEYAHHSDGFVDTDALLAKAKEIEDQVLKPKPAEDQPSEAKPKQETTEPSSSSESTAPKANPSEPEKKS